MDPKEASMKTIIAQTQEEADRLQKENPDDLIGMPSKEHQWTPEALAYFKRFGCKVVDTTKLETGTVIFDGEVI